MFIFGLSRREVVAEVGLVSKLLDYVVSIVQSLYICARVHGRHCHRATRLGCWLSCLLAL